MHESLLKNLVTTILDKARRVCALWALFDDENLLGNMIMKRLESEIREVAKGLGIPTHAHDLMKGEIVDVHWDRVTKVLDNMIIVRAKLTAIYQLRPLERITGEDDLTFVSRGHMIFKWVESTERGQDYVTFLFKELPAQHQQKVLEHV